MRLPYRPRHQAARHPTARLQRVDIAALLWPNGNAVRDRKTEDLIQRPGFAGIAGLIAVLRVPLQQSLPLQIPADAPRQGLGQWGELGA
ncbi:MAG: hypothetical protein WBM84_08170 [Sedimenticolaceae bacterium]